MSRIQMVLTALCALLALALIYEVAAPAPEFSVPMVNAPQRAAAAPAFTPYAPPPATAFDAINSRALFDPRRQPIKSVNGPETSAPPPQITLLGVILSPDRRLAIVKSQSSPLALSIGVGETIEGWQVTAIEADRLVLHSGSSDDVIKLDKGGAGGDAGAPGQPAPAPIQITQ